VCLEEKSEGWGEKVWASGCVFVGFYCLVLLLSGVTRRPPDGTQWYVIREHCNSNAVTDAYLQRPWEFLFLSLLKSHSYVTWLIYMRHVSCIWEMTILYVIQLIDMRQTWLFKMRHKSFTCDRHDSFICDTTHAWDTRSTTGQVHGMATVSKLPQLPGLCWEKSPILVGLFCNRDLII